jgi:anaerobic selenocysteine-containing dehydrogenase
VFVVGANPMVSFPNTESLRSGFARDDVFTVVHEQFMTDTARYADLVLPATTQLESTDVVQPWGHMYLGWNNAAIEPMGESVSNSELHRRIAGALQLTEPALFESDRVALAAALPGVDLDDFQRRKTIRVPYPDDGRPYGDGSFATTSGRVQLTISDPDEGVPALPDYRAGEPLRDDEFVLMTPKRHVGFLNSSYAHLASHQPPTGPLLELHPDDARRLGFAEGDHVVVASDRGSTALPCTLSDDMLQGVVAIPWGWWAGHDDRVANSLTTDELTDWGEGATFGDTVVTLRLR